MSECSCDCPDCPGRCECAERSTPVDKLVDERLGSVSYSKVQVSDEDLKSAPADVMGQFVYREHGGEQIPVRYEPLTTAEARDQLRLQIRDAWNQIDSRLDDTAPLFVDIEAQVMAEIERWAGGAAFVHESDEIRATARRIISIVQYRI